MRLPREYEIETLHLHCPQTVVPGLKATVMGSKTITVSNLLITESGEIGSFLPVMWNTTYTGNNTVTEKVYYSIDGGPKVQFSAVTIPGYSSDPFRREYVNYAQLDVRKLPRGVTGLWCMQLRPTLRMHRKSPMSMLGEKEKPS
jgi:hypothetical protein